MVLISSPQIHPNTPKTTSKSTKPIKTTQNHPKPFLAPSGSQVGPNSAIIGPKIEPYAVYGSCLSHIWLSIFSRSHIYSKCDYSNAKYGSLATLFINICPLGKIIEQLDYKPPK